MTTMLHFGYYKPRLAALSFPRQPSSGCLWPMINQVKMGNEEEEKSAQQQQKMKNEISNGQSRHHH